MRILIACISTILFSATVCQAQIDSKTTAISFELGKTGLIYNLSVDHKIPSQNFGFRLSMGSNFVKNLNAKFLGGGVYYLTGKANRFLELGADLYYVNVEEVSDDQRSFTVIYPNYSIKTLYPSVNIGYRAYGKHTLFRIGISPGVIDKELIPGGYISFGVRL